MLRLYRFRYSTNVERVALALAYKGSRSSPSRSTRPTAPVREVSGQDLVPVLVDGDEVITDSTRILHHLERRFPSRRCSRPIRARAPRSRSSSTGSTAPGSASRT